jgi:hypothetical protein
VGATGEVVGARDRVEGQRGCLLEKGVHLEGWVKKGLLHWVKIRERLFMGQCG